MGTIQLLKRKEKERKDTTFLFTPFACKLTTCLLLVSCLEKADVYAEILCSVLSCYN